MSKDKQILKMQKVLSNSNIVYGMGEYTDIAISEAFYNAGYREASEVAREIFEELEKHTVVLGLGDATRHIYFRGIEKEIINELKKKHEVDGQ